MPSHQVRSSLSRRLLWLTIGVVLLVQVLFFVPVVVRARRDWLSERIAYGQLAALSISEASPPASEHDDTASRADLLRGAGVEAVRLTQPAGETVVLGTVEQFNAGRTIDLAHEDNLRALWRTVMALADGRDQAILITAHGPVRPDTVVWAVFRSAALTGHLRAFARDVAILGLLVAGLTGVVIHLALLELLVRPMRRLTNSIAAFRADPERTPPLEPNSLTPWRGDEIAVAGHELAAMQRELRAALWRHARLAALGTAAAKVSHDLRSILAPALLSAERLQGNGDPNVRRIGDTVVRAVERATELVRGGLEFAREGPMTLSRRRILLPEVVADATEQVKAVLPALLVESLVGPELEIDADREHICRVLSNLLRNAGEAGASRVTIEAAICVHHIQIFITDDGPGLPQRVEAVLFKPFTTGGRRGSVGLGLAIARDLMRAHLGEVDLVSTGPGGTRFRLTLPATLALKSPVRTAAAGAG